MTRPRLVYVVTHPVSARLLLWGQLAQMRAWGFDVTVIAAPGPDLDTVREREKVEVIGMPMHRSIALNADAKSLAHLTNLFRKLRPAIVNASTTKAGLLGMLAARAVNVPIRIYLLRGLRLETTRGATRVALGVTERLASACAGRVVCVSDSLQRNFIAGGYTPEHKTCVLANGSSNGVDPERFKITAERLERAREIRVSLGISPTALVIGFVGRLVPDKGIRELLDAFDLLRSTYPEVHLLLLGNHFGDDTIAPELVRRVQRTPRVITASQVTDTAPYYAAMDVLAFPSHREGFPNVPLEAAVAKLPIAGFRVTGVVDAVEDDRTGLLVERGDVRGLAAVLARYLDDANLRRTHGESGHARVHKLFTQQIVWRAWAEEYTRLLQAKALPLPLGI